MNIIGTDEAAFKSVLNNEDLSADDWVKIMLVYNDKYGSLIQHVDKDFSGIDQDDIMSKLGSKMLDAAKSGNVDAIDLICKEFHNATAEMLGTADEFIAEIMDNASDEVLTEVLQRYSTVNNGSDMVKDVKNDFSSDIEKKYVERLNKLLEKLKS